MPYALRESETGELLACVQVNGYRLPYFGIRLWDRIPDEEEAREALSEAGIAGSSAAWLPVELTEHQAKMANVKLRNDPRRRVRLLNGALAAEVSER